MNKRNKFLLIYAVIIIVLLVCIMFIFPDSLFSRKYDANYKKYFGDKIQTQTKKAEFKNYEEQQKQLVNGNYNYEYMILDSMGTSSKHFECSGTIKDSKETGKCTSPVLIEYTKENKNEVFKDIGSTYLEPSTIFNLVKDLTPELKQHNTYREYTYKLKIKGLDTTIIIQTTLEEISQISINNPYMTYLLKYESVKVDN